MSYITEAYCILSQESRRILVGEYQHVVYRHFLPRLLGRQVMTRHGIVVSETSPTEYSDRVNPSIKNEFSTAAFRYGHSAVQVSLYFWSDLYSVEVD